MISPLTRDTALALWADFLPHAGAAYAARRNIDPGPGRRSHTSRLSPYLRHRVLTEAELARATHREHGQAGAKFIEEICWRTYWKGWLEAHPGVWRSYLQDAAHPPTPDVAAAIRGETGIDCFDAWVAELQAHKYLHNHTRMWFASIWIHTLRLPWALGAAFFAAHLIDFDPASNTLSWRWVAGLQTRGKAYLARPDNIARYTEGRFHPTGLADSPWELTEAPPTRCPVPAADRPPNAPFLLCLHEDDLDGDGHFQSLRPVAHIMLAAGALIEAAAAADVRLIATPYAPVGPTADALAALESALTAAGLKLLRLRRPWDETAWPHAKKGFFAFRDVIPKLL